ncbi:MAG TPA: hypothetical protein VID19_11380 [Candidatus Eremiobacteraceae bacterium]
MSTGFQPGSFNGHGAIVTGPDGNLWFTECLNEANPGFGRIGKITTSGVLTEYPLTGGVERCPSQIATGPDGAMWFTEYAWINANPPPALGRIDMTGKITEYPLPASDVNGDSIVRGSNGNLWYDAQGVSSGSAIREYSTLVHAVIDSVIIPPPMVPGTLVVNPVDGSILAGTLVQGGGLSDILQVVPGTSGTYVVKYIPSPANSGDWSNLAVGRDGNIYVQFVPSDASGSPAGLAQMNESTYNVTLITEPQFTHAFGNQVRTHFRGPIIYGPDANIYVWDEGQQDDFIGLAALTKTGSLLAQQDDGSGFHDVADGITIGQDGKIWIATMNQLASEGSIFQLTPVH